MSATEATLKPLLARTAPRFARTKCTMLSGPEVTRSTVGELGKAAARFGSAGLGIIASLTGGAWGRDTALVSGGGKVGVGVDAPAAGAVSGGCAFAESVGVGAPGAGAGCCG